MTKREYIERTSHAQYVKFFTEQNHHARAVCHAMYISLVELTARPLIYNQTIHGEETIATDDTTNYAITQ